MRKTGFFIAAFLLSALVAAAVAGLDRRPPTTGKEGVSSNLPIVLRPENTPTPTPLPTATNTPPPPTPPATRVPAPSPTPGFGPNLLKNGSFEDGWRDLPPQPGNQINQEPLRWTLTWLTMGQEVWDPRPKHHDDPGIGIVSGVPEMVHKIGGGDPEIKKPTLPPEEWFGGVRALILDGTRTYKIFHKAGVFAAQLSQQVTLQPGRYRLTVPVQLHWQEKLDPKDPTWDTFTAESGAWALVNGAPVGGSWATAREMGDRRWYYHVIEFNLASPATVEARIRVKSIYRSAKDFFIDAIWLERIN